ncbi:beta strand repeat-containing protein [Undibacterium sp. TJN19]|uniref:beta strand repeat-containing protein n=1 Tax=Undibacterium sp. TJN19 TaxID=3413055 RepID=UPI003BF247C8
MMKFIREVFALLLLVGLTACGGGGGSPGNTSGGAALFTTAPALLTIAPGEVRTYNIGGGVPSYFVTTSSSAAFVSVNGSVLTITGGSAGGGKATISVKDGAGTAVSIDVTVGTGIDLFTSAPASGITVPVGGTSAVYTIGGGSLIYNVVSNNLTIASVTLVNNTFVVNGLVGGKTTVTVKDSLGKVTVDIPVTVGSNDPLFTTASNSVNVGVGAAATFTVGGGNGPYTVGSSNNAVGTASISGTTLTITGLSVGSTNVVVRDASQGIVTITVTVGSTAQLFTSAPTALVVPVGGSSPTFTIGGGSQIYTATSGNTQIATVGINGNKFVISGVSPGSTTINIKDSLGANVAINLTVGSGATFYTTAPSSITVAVGGSNSFIVGGGTAPFTATSSNTSVVTTSVSGNNVVINGLTPGSAVVSLREAGGGSPISINVTVGSGSVNGVFTTAPAAITIATGASPTYQIGGGTAPYSATSSNVAIATASVTGTTLTITGVSTGAATILVKDSSGSPVTISVSVGTGTSVALYTSSPATLNLTIGASPVYTIGGGTGPYTATTSDARIVTAVVSGSSLTLTGVAAGSANVSVVDSVGARVPISVSVIGTTSATLAVTPNASTGYVGDLLAFRIDGGAAPYTITSNNQAIASVANGTVATSGGIFNVTLAKIGATSLVIADASGNTSLVSITVVAPVTTMSISPNVFNINETNVATINLNITGGNAPFQVFTSSTLLSSVSGSNPDPLNPLSFNGRVLSVALGTQGTRCVAADTAVTITVKDSQNVTATSTMTIKDLNGGAGC